MFHVETVEDSLIADSEETITSLQDYVDSLDDITARVFTSAIERHERDGKLVNCTFQTNDVTTWMTAATNFFEDRGFFINKSENQAAHRSSIYVLPSQLSLPSKKLLSMTYFTSGKIMVAGHLLNQFIVNDFAAIQKLLGTAGAYQNSFCQADEQTILETDDCNIARASLPLFDSSSDTDNSDASDHSSAIVMATRVPMPPTPPPPTVTTSVLTFLSPTPVPIVNRLQQKSRQWTDEQEHIWEAIHQLIEEKSSMQQQLLALQQQHNEQSKQLDLLLAGRKSSTGMYSSGKAPVRVVAVSRQDPVAATIAVPATGTGTVPPTVPIVIPTVADTSRKQQQQQTTADLLILGDSTIRHIDAKRIAKSSLAVKVTAQGKLIRHFVEDIELLRKQATTYKNIILHVGSNDVSTNIGAIVADFSALLRKTTSQFPDARIFVSSILHKKGDANMLSSISNINGAIKNICEDAAVTFINHATTFTTAKGNRVILNEKLFLSDNSYLNQHGTRLFARNLIRALHPVLAAGNGSNDQGQGQHTTSPAVEDSATSSPALPIAARLPSSAEVPPRRPIHEQPAALLPQPQHRPQQNQQRPSAPPQQQHHQSTQLPLPSFVGQQQQSPHLMQPSLTNSADMLRPQFLHYPPLPIPSWQVPHHQLRLPQQQQCPMPYNPIPASFSFNPVGMPMPMEMPMGMPYLLSNGLLANVGYPGAGVYPNFPPGLQNRDQGLLLPR